MSGQLRLILPSPGPDASTALKGIHEDALSRVSGRYTALFAPQARYRAQFNAVVSFDFAERFNIAPASIASVLRQSPDGSRRFTMAKWGLIPASAKHPNTDAHLINAMAETAAIKPDTRDAFRKRRILVPAEAFYESKREVARTTPYVICMQDQSTFGMAGLLEYWRSPTGESIATFTILTVAANPLVAQIHSRMPAIIGPADYAAWLDPAIGDVQRLQRLLVPYPAEMMDLARISTETSRLQKGRSRPLPAAPPGLPVEFAGADHECVSL